MGYIKHHAIVVTGGQTKKAHKLAKKIFGHLVSKIIDSKLNGYSSFFIAPDGSKEGWTDSVIGDKNRDGFVKELRKNYCCDFVEVKFGGDDPFVGGIINHNFQN